MRFARRETLLAAAFAVWGLAIAISLAGVWHAPAPADQLPGFAKLQNFDAHGPFRFIFGLIVVPLALPLLARPLIRRLANAQAWAGHATIAAALVAIWHAVIVRDPLWTIVPFALAIATFTLLAERELAFTRHDWILLPAFNATLIAILDITRLPLQRAVVVAAAVVLAVRIAVAFLPSPLEPAFAFLLAPLGVVFQTSFFARDQRYFGWHALLLVVAAPFVLRAFLRDRRRALAILTFIVYPIFVFAYPNATSMLPGEGKPRLNMFEDGHTIPIASEYLRGERPYRDAQPGHGLLEDGVFDYLAFRLRGVNLGAALHTRAVAGLLNAVAIYALGAAITGAAEAGLLTYVFWQLTTSAWTIRATPALFTLLMLVLAVRRRNPRWFAAAGVGAVLCGITSLDYAFYTTVVFAIAVLRFGRTGWKHAATGIAAGVVPLFAIFAAFGILDDFFSTTFLELPRISGGYTLSFFAAPPSIDVKPFPELLPAWFALDALPHLTWCAAAIATAVLLTKRRTRLREPFVLLGIWVLVAAISYGERHHLFFDIVLAAMLIPAAWLALRRRFALAVPLVIALVIASHPTAHLAVVDFTRHLRGPAEAGWRELQDPPRARGALIHDVHAAEIASARKYVELTLKPDETYFDFTNRALLFFLLRRDNPVRFTETGYYAPEARQREVIAALEANPNVRAALVPPGGTAVDGVANELRAPLVWQYLQQHFVPDFQEGQVTFWRRK